LCRLQLGDSHSAAAEGLVVPSALLCWVAGCSTQSNSV
jgi:hypothetical protein